MRLSLSGKSVLVTGGAGFIGGHLVDRIVREAPAKLVVVDSFFLGREENLRGAHAAFPGLRVVRMDAADLAAMRQIAGDESIDVLFDLAVVPLPTSLEFPAWTVEKNVAIATTCAELARTRLIKTLVHCSSSEAYGSAEAVPMDESHPLAAITPYAASKAAADQVVLSYCRTFGIDAIVARPFNNFGPRQNDKAYAGIIPIVIDRVRRGVPIEIYGDGLQTRDYVFVEDTAEALLRIYGNPEARSVVVNVSTGREISVNDLVAALLKALGAPTHPVVHVAPRPGDVRRHCGGHERLARLTEFTPRGIDADTLASTVRWYQAVQP
jgi:UDP-glucose 4-epimerase